jgi:FADH2 O2-dependent halogenase
VWVLHFNNGITSAGVAATDEAAARLELSKGEQGWRRLLDLIPGLKTQFAEAKPLFAFVHVPRLAYRSSQVAGPNWALLPSAAGFVDPLLSTGIPLSLLGVGRLAQIIETDWATPRFDEHLRAYGKQTDRELVATARLIGALYASMNDFPVFVALTLLYFAAASFAETARRLGKPHLASSFLLCDDAGFAAAFARITERAGRLRSADASDSLVREILQAIEPINVAGLGNTERANWYPVHAEDLFNAAGKLGATRDDIAELLRGCEFDLPQRV